jgi:hypothetical protein
MKMFAILALGFVTSSTALADGFVCANDEIVVKVYNNTDAAVGTRTAAVMVVSDPQVGAGRKTIARFTDANGLIQSNGASYTSNVDLRFGNSSRKGELIGGTKLGELDTIQLDVDFSYSAPIAAGTHVAGLLTLNKRNGQSIELELDCKRYLKQ